MVIWPCHAIIHQQVPIKLIISTNKDYNKFTVFFYYSHNYGCKETSIIFIQVAIYLMF
jgi:hypothetical protein